MYLKFSRFELIFVFTFLVSLGAISIASSKQESPHGGIIKEADGYFIEVKNAAKNFNVYLLNNKMEPIGTKNITGKAQFFFPDSTDLEMNLKPMNDKAFNCVPPPGYYASKITFNIMGKTVSARFPSQNTVVLKE